MHVLTYSHVFFPSHPVNVLMTYNSLIVWLVWLSCTLKSSLVLLWLHHCHHLQVCWTYMCTFGLGIDPYELAEKVKETKNKKKNGPAEVEIDSHSKRQCRRKNRSNPKLLHRNRKLLLRQKLTKRASRKRTSNHFWSLFCSSFYKHVNSC